MLNQYNPLHMFLASYGNELNRVDFRILKESKNSSSPSSFSYNGLLYSFNPDLNMFVNQFGHAMDYAQAVALAASLGYSDQEFEGLADSTDTDGGTDRRRSTIANNQLWFSSDTPPFNWYKQGQTWGSQFGLDHHWPMVNMSIIGKTGPSRALMDSGVFKQATPSGVFGIAEDTSWDGVGNPSSNGFDIDWRLPVWNTSTGYISMTFGSPGHYPLSDVNAIISQYSWIPEEYRMSHSQRHWRGVNDVYLGGITGSEFVIVGSSPVRTPWIKRKINFVRKEKRNVYEYLKGQSFYIKNFQSDDEYYNYLGLLGIDNNTNIQTQYLYPINSSTGSTWYADFSGICAAPDTLITRGITSLRSYLLTRGWTTNSNKWTYVDGITCRGQNSGITGNISISGSVDNWYSDFYNSALKDWIGLHVNDVINDFKEIFELNNDNCVLTNYGYYKSNVGLCGYSKPPSDVYFTGIQKQLSTDYPVAFPDPLVFVEGTDNGDRSSSITKYFSYENTSNSADVIYNLHEQCGNQGSIHTYGSSIASALGGGGRILDRQLDFIGNSYGYKNASGTFGIKHVYAFKNWNRYNNLGLNSSTKPKKFIPANYLGSTAPAAANGIDLLYCAETSGLTTPFVFDPSGVTARGCCAAICGTDRSPDIIPWLLNPVWGITQINGTSVCPANYVPIYNHALQLQQSMTQGYVSLEYNLQTGGGSFTGWNLNHFDPCGYPIPGNTLPAGSLYTNYWTHWYPIAFAALLHDVKWGRHLAVGNVFDAVAQRAGVLPETPNSVWNKIQKPINCWISTQLYVGDGSDDLFASPSTTRPSLGSSFYKLYLYDLYFVPTGIKRTIEFSNSTANDFGSLRGEAGPLYYENIRHQYLNKTWNYSYWNPLSYVCVWGLSGGSPTEIGQAQNQKFPLGYSPSIRSGVTCMGICGDVAYTLARKVNTVIKECNTLGSGIVSETMYLAPVNMDEREYLLSGAQLTNGSYLWRITFTHPATSSVYIQGNISGSGTGITYDVAGITDYINFGNNKFGVWWSTNQYEIPILTNPPVPEAQRLGVLNLPMNGITYNPLTMLRGATNGGTPTFIT